MRVSIRDIAAQCAAGERLTMVTAYDYTSARLIDETSIPMILVGDSLGMVMQGRDSTLPVTLDDIVYHTKMVVRGAQRPLVVADLPFLTYTTPQDALRSAGRLMAEGGAQSVKLEGGAAQAATIRTLVDAGIPVMAHLGFTPQSVHQIGLKVQGKDVARARQLIEEARAVQEAGAWAVVLELIPAPLAAQITRLLSIPTIGIGAGVECSGEVQVWHDILGLYEEVQARHTKRYATLGRDVVAALQAYDAEVRDRTFPTTANSARLDPQVLGEALAAAGVNFPEP
ncbi:MAG: 3-methyl-2-oxobutanoate hydroxymethyltransferase [Micrococcales bacterium]|nr:MAG: 3-methyl-2-oxobutanoate hydroxymethyltransferase [Micrococcales bacterium]PIE28096.1 MAG: 3-methyl-2-oxobutanoate hydroxymethyltransferase [Micrococcales bacterium]